MLARMRESLGEVPRRGSARETESPPHPHLKQDKPVNRPPDGLEPITDLATVATSISEMVVDGRNQEGIPVRALVPGDHPSLRPHPAPSVGGPRPSVTSGGGRSPRRRVRGSKAALRSVGSRYRRGVTSRRGLTGPGLRTQPRSKGRSQKRRPGFCSISSPTRRGAGS